MGDTWPWLALAGLGAFHGVNPAMGWLFATALGMHQRRRSVVLLSLVPLALGHALSILLVAGGVVLLGLVVDLELVRRMAGLLLLGWAAWHWRYGSRHRFTVGMQAGFGGLAIWSFLMATAHGAGLMLVPALIPLCLAATPGSELVAAGSLPIVLAAVGVHTAAMLVVTGGIAVLVYEWLDVAFLRKGWINLDLLWSAALVVTGAILLFL
jgi:hypothetical protein